MQANIHAFIDGIIPEVSYFLFWVTLNWALDAQTLVEYGPDPSSWMGDRQVEDAQDTVGNNYTQSAP